LELVRRDEAGQVLERVVRWINRPGTEAEAHLAVDCPPPGQRCGWLASWGHPEGRPAREVRLSVGAAELYRGRPEQLPRPLWATAAEGATVGTLEVEFADRRGAVAAALVGASHVESAETSLQPLPLTLHDGAPTDAELLVRLRNAGMPARAVERGPARLVFVLAPDVFDRAPKLRDRLAARSRFREGPGDLRLPGQDRRPTLGGAGSKLAGALDEVDRAYVVVAHSKLSEFDAFSYSRGRAGWLRALLEGPPQVAAPGLRIAEGLAAVAQAAGPAFQRRVVVLLVGGASPDPTQEADGSRFSTASARAYLEQLGVPLLVWRLGDAVSPEWPDARPVRGERDFEQALEEASQVLARQRVAWVEGEPPEALALPAGLRAAALVPMAEPPATPEPGAAVEPEPDRLGARPAQPPETPTFSAAVELVLVDAVVLDQQGRPVAGLRREDFELREDDVIQEVASFEAVGSPPPPGEGGPGGRVERERLFLLVLDDARLTPAQAGAARQAVARFLAEDARGGDRVALLFSTDGRMVRGKYPDHREGLLAALDRLQGHFPPFRDSFHVAEDEAVRIIAYGDDQALASVADRFLAQFAGNRPDQAEALALARARAGEVYAQSAGRSRQTLGVLEKAIASLAGVRGRKAVVLASQGFPHDSSLAGFGEVRKAALRVNAALYFLDARGLSAPGGARDLYGASQGAEALAADTGGFTLRNTNELARGLRRIADESSVYYLLGYAPSPGPPGRFRKLEVRVKRRGLQVRARQGYEAPAPGLP
jgi:VWFA-related protein